MKRYNLYIITFILGLFLFNACQDEDLVKKGNKVEEGIPVTLKLSFGAKSVNHIQTRTDIGESENTVKDLYVFVFTKSGSSWIKEAGQLFNVNSASEGSITMTANSVTSGYKRIFAVGNIEALEGEYNLSIANLEAVTDISDLNALVANMEHPAVERSGGLLVSGAFVTESVTQTETGYCEINVPADGTLVAVDGQIQLKRLDAKIKFVVSSADSVVFIPKSWRVEHYPVSANLIEQSDNDAETIYHSSSDESFENYTKHTSGSNNEDFAGGDFTFYMFENHKTNASKSLSYEDRERQEKKPSGKGNYTNGQFLNADENATYVVMTGDYKVYKSDGTVKTSADVKYTVHLGDINLGNNNFDTDRNTSYLYSVKVVGVENIVTEVVKEQIDDETQPGAEGDVVRSDQSFLFDSHYETHVVTFQKNNLSNLSVIVKTPYNSYGTYELNGGGNAVESDFKDYEWVAFRKNAKNRSGKKYVASSDFAQYKPSEVIGIKDLLEELHNNLNSGNGKDDFWDNNNEVKYTVFVDEYFYDTNPVTKAAASWKDFVNVDNRQMYILCNTQKSPDQASSLTTSSIMIDQRSIKTIYDNSVANSGWGIETVEENGPAYPSSFSNVQTETATNGRYNFFKLIGLLNDGAFVDNREWADFVESKSNSMQKRYSVLDYACLNRNRDLNGDGKITADEVRWYLPATNQFTGLWLGRDALSPEVRLFQGRPSDVTKSDRFKYHYFSSNLVRFWAEEGAATGSNEEERTTRSKIRCARNLGAYDRSIPKVSEEPEDFVIPTYDNKKVIKITLTRVNSGALRSDAVAAQRVGHAEHSGAYLNRPYKAFKVATVNTSANFDRAKLANNTYVACTGVIDGETGWRVPNQRELSLIAGYTKEDFTDEIGSCTYSDLSKYKKTNIYCVKFSSDFKINTVHLNSTDVSLVRCVKDIEP